MPTRRCTALLAALLLAAGACSESDDGVSEGQKTTYTDDTPPPRSARQLVDVPLETLAGARATLAGLADGRVVVFTFGVDQFEWCVKQFEELDRVVEAYGDKVLVLDIYLLDPTLKGSASAAAASHTRRQSKARAMVCASDDAREAYGFNGVPRTVVADHEGGILYEGAYTPFDKLKPLLDVAVARAQ